MKGLIIAIGLWVLIASTSGLRCAPCIKSESRCAHTAEPVDCPFGLVTDICNCCYVCGKGPDEKCGGPWNFDGKCGTGLECVPISAVYMWGYEGTCQERNNTLGEDY